MNEMREIEWLKQLAALQIYVFPKYFDFHYKQISVKVLFVCEIGGGGGRIVQCVRYVGPISKQHNKHASHLYIHRKLKILQSNISLTPKLVRPTRNVCFI